MRYDKNGKRIRPDGNGTGKSNDEVTSNEDINCEMQYLRLLKDIKTNGKYKKTRNVKW